MSCERYAQAIADHACGSDLAPAAAAHLDSCMRCAAAFEVQRRALEDLDAELQRAVAIDPSPAFAPAVRAGIDGASPGGYQLAWLAAPLGIGAALAIAVLLGAPGDRPAAPVTSSTPVAGPPPATFTRATPAHSAPAPAPVRAPAVPMSERAIVEPRRRSPVQSPSAGHEVIVPPDQARALARYMALVRRGGIDAAALVQPPAELQAPADLVVDPLTVAPIGTARPETLTAAADGGTQKE
jgi:hypothetical protein